MGALGGSIQRAANQYQAANEPKRLLAEHGTMHYHAESVLRRKQNRSIRILVERLPQS